MKKKERKTIRKKNQDIKFIIASILTEIKSGANTKVENETLRSMRRSVRFTGNLNYKYIRSLTMI